MIGDGGAVVQADVSDDQRLSSSSSMPPGNPADDEVFVDIQRWVINLFIIFHLSAIVFWNLPNTDLQLAVCNFFRSYMVLTGNWQNWCMFSPDPVAVDTYLGATIHYQDGSTRQYTFPRISKLRPISKYRQERWRKFIENTQADGDTAHWPYLARYAAIVNNVSPATDPVKSVDLYRFYRYIAQPGNPPTKYVSYKMLTEHVASMPSAQILLRGS
jgi:hypothetical protein